MLKTDIEYVEFELSTVCQAACPLCYRNYKTFKSHYPEKVVRDLDSVKNQILEYPNLKWIYLVGSISEPTTYPHFLELVQFIKSRGILIELCTNGSTRNTRWWKELGGLLTEDDKVYFTVCGSTQEIHETYRKGTNLRKILENASALRSVCKCDYAQCIRFAYNDADLSSSEFLEMIKDFTNVYWTETFLLQDDSVYSTGFDRENFMPHPANRAKFLKLLELAKKIDKIPHKCDCESKFYKKIQIDVYGNVYPCYLFLEASGGKPWNGNYGEIEAGKYSVCKFCEIAIKKYCIKNNLCTVI